MGFSLLMLSILFFCKLLTVTNYSKDILTKQFPHPSPRLKFLSRPQAKVPIYIDFFQYITSVWAVNNVGMWVQSCLPSAKCLNSLTIPTIKMCQKIFQFPPAYIFSSFNYKIAFFRFLFAYNDFVNWFVSRGNK